ncbi:MAG: heparinase II/III family protein [Candidatus Poribacteria bacterium]
MGMASIPLAILALNLRKQDACATVDKGKTMTVKLLLFALLWSLSLPSAWAAWPNLRGRNEARQRELRQRLREIRLERPRIFLTNEEIEAVRSRIDQNSSIRECYQWLKDWAYSGQFYRNLWATPKQLQGAVVAYRLEGKPPQLLANCVRIMDYLCEAEPNSWTYPRVVRGLSMAYDWLYDDLTDKQKQKYGRRIIECAKACYDTWRHTELNNHVYLEYGPILYAGIALFEEGIDDATAEQLLLDGMQLLLDGFIPAHALLAQDGGWYESMSYHAFFTMEYAHLLELWQHATGEQVWSGSGGLQGDAHWLVYNARPWNDSRVHVADIGHSSSQDLGIAWYLPLLWARHQDGVARFWTEKLKSRALAGHKSGKKYALSPYMWWPYIVWYDETVPIVPREELPLARLFRGVGWVSMRGSWTPDASFALFICSDWWGGHQHCDNNSFVIHKYAPLAIDSGVYDAGPHRANYSARTIAHNTITVYDPEEEFFGGTWGQSGKTRTVNDGGQLYTPSPPGVAACGPGTEFDRGDIIAYELTPWYTYVVGDATRSYSSSKVKEFKRAFLHLRPDLFVVFDRVESTNAEFVKRWLLHSINEPVIDGKTITLKNGQGSLTCRTVYPSRVQIVAIGGPGHEFEVNGQNFPASKNDPEAGSWRVEVSPSQPAKRDYFLHVLRTSGTTPIVPSTELLRTENSLGVRIVDEGQIYEINFAITDRLTGHLRILDSGGKIILARDLAVDLPE